MRKNYMGLLRSPRNARIMGVKPDLYFDSVFNFNPNGYGLKTLIFDWEGTLSPWGTASPYEGVREYVQGLIESGYHCVLLSNLTPKLRGQKREAFVRQVRETTGLEVIVNHPFKPDPRGVWMAMDGSSPVETALIGDLIYTDVLAGRRAGIGLVVLVDPLDTSSEPFYVRHIVRPLEARYKRIVGVPKSDLAISTH